VHLFQQIIAGLLLVVKPEVQSSTRVQLAVGFGFFTETVRLV